MLALYCTARHLMCIVTVRVSGVLTSHCHCELSEEVDEVQCTRPQFEVQDEGGYNRTEQFIEDVHLKGG